MSLTQVQKRAAWSPPCSGPSITVALNGTGKVTMSPALWEALQAFNQVLQHWDYRTRAADTGGFVCRNVKRPGGEDSNVKSIHAYKGAMDLNWTTNPFSPGIHSDMPPGLRADLRAIRLNNGVQAWEWGGDWGGSKDNMHWEVGGRPGDYATGVNWATVAGSPGTPPPYNPAPITEPPGGPDMFLILEGIGFIGLAGGIAWPYNDLQSYANAVDKSKNATVMFVPKDHADDVFKKLVNQTLVATGKPPAA